MMQENGTSTLTHMRDAASPPRQLFDLQCAAPPEPVATKPRRMLVSKVALFNNEPFYEQSKRAAIAALGIL
jgi:hypothetical protein